MERMTGIEPVISTLARLRHTTWLHPRKSLVEPTGDDPATSCVQGKRSPN